MKEIILSMNVDFSQLGAHHIRDDFSAFIPASDGDEGA